MPTKSKKFTEMLQLSAAELKQEVQDRLYSNFLLEKIETKPTEFYDYENKKEVFSLSFLSGKISNEIFEKEQKNSSNRNLKSYLIWQMQMSNFSKTEREIAEEIIKNINSDGFLMLDKFQINKNLKRSNISEKKISLVLNRIQSFDPPGIGASNLKDSLLIQARQLPDKLDCKDRIIELLENYFHLLIKKNFKKIKEEMNISKYDLDKTLLLVRLLNPAPGKEIENEKTNYIEPEVNVVKKNGKWDVVLIASALPKIKINYSYAELIKETRDYQNDTRFKGDLKQANWLIESIKKREDALLKVSRCIIDNQIGFLHHGELAMIPMKLADIAEKVGLHESTISRITEKKYIQTPKGIFELKYFFSSGSKLINGNLISSLAIKEKIKNIIDLENPQKPLSDQLIKNILEQEGIYISRRAITKYRVNLLIPSSYKRKKY